MTSADTDATRDLSSDPGEIRAPSEGAVTSCPLRCQCGTIKATLLSPRTANRAVCYCHDCQAFALFLGQADRVLDPLGGSEILQALPRNIIFSAGSDALACVRLTDRGMLRWYAGCCGTPIGNTLATRQLSFVGLVRVFVGITDAALEDLFGPVVARVHTTSAREGPRPKEMGGGRLGAWFVRTTLRAWLNGDHRRTPFFHRDTGAPVATPWVLTRAEHARVMTAVRAGG